MAVPVVSSISPDHGPPGTLITLVGANFDGGTDIQVGAISCATFTFIDDNNATCECPSEGPGAAFVQVQNVDGFSAPVDPDNLFTVESTAPFVSSVVPSFGPTAGGNSAVVTGINFVDVTDVWIQDGDFNLFAVSYVVDSDTQITATMPAHIAEVVHVIVCNASYGCSG